jgi:hypothetical protein
MNQNARLDWSLTSLKVPLRSLLKTARLAVTMSRDAILTVRLASHSYGPRFYGSQLLCLIQYERRGNG